MYAVETGHGTVMVPEYYLRCEFDAEGLLVACSQAFPFAGEDCGASSAGQ